MSDDPVVQFVVRDFDGPAYDPDIRRLLMTTSSLQRVRTRLVAHFFGTPFSSTLAIHYDFGPSTKGEYAAVGINPDLFFTFDPVMSRMSNTDCVKMIVPLVSDYPSDLFRTALVDDAIHWEWLLNAVGMVAMDDNLYIEIDYV